MYRLSRIGSIFALTGYGRRLKHREKGLGRLTDDNTDHVTIKKAYNNPLARTYLQEAFVTLEQRQMGWPAVRRDDSVGEVNLAVRLWSIRK